MKLFLANYRFTTSEIYRVILEYPAKLGYLHIAGTLLELEQGISEQKEPCLFTDMQISDRVFYSLVSIYGQCIVEWDQNEGSLSDLASGGDFEKLNPSQVKSPHPPRAPQLWNNDRYMMLTSVSRSQ